MRIANYGQPARVIIVDDGSRDNSQTALQVRRRRPRLPSFASPQLRPDGCRRFCQAARSSSPWTPTCRNRPMDIPLLMAGSTGATTSSSGWHQDRQDRWLDRKLPHDGQSAGLQRDRRQKLHDYGCSLRPIRTEVLRRITPLRPNYQLHPGAGQFCGRHHHRVPVEATIRANFGSSMASAAPCVHARPDQRLVLEPTRHLIPRLRHVGSLVHGVRRAHRPLSFVHQNILGEHRAAATAGPCCSVLSSAYNWYHGPAGRG